MTDRVALAERFDAERPRLVAIASRLLGSPAEAEDAVQETWLRLERAPVREITNLGGWLTTVVSRICLDELRTARRRHERPWRVEPWPESPVAGSGDPESEAVQSEQVGLALTVVLDRLSVAERVAFVLFDVFDFPYPQIARVLDRRPDATRQLVSRARTKVRRSTAGSAPDRIGQRAVVTAWLSAVEIGDVRAILGILSEDAVLCADLGNRLDRIEGAEAIAGEARRSARLAANSVLVLVDGEPGVAAVMRGRVVSVLAFDIGDGRIDSLDILAHPGRLERMGVLDEIGAEASG